jgi:hypothetical protein
MKNNTKLISNLYNQCECNYRLNPTESTSSLTTEEWLTTKQAAEFLKISESSLRNQTSRGKILCYKLFRSNRYLKSELEQLLRRNRIGEFSGN